MKRRQTFVSNSSSSSFCILGTIIDDMDIIEEYENIIYDKKIDLEIVYGIDEYYDHYIIGVSPGSLDHDKTINENIEIIKQDLEKIGIKGPSIDWYVDGGRNG